MNSSVDSIFIFIVAALVNAFHRPTSPYDWRTEPDHWALPAPEDFDVSKQTTERQVRARTTLWNADESNFTALKNIKNPVLVADGRDDVVDKPVNSVNMARQIPFSWLAFFDGGHAFLFQEHEKFAATVNAFLK